MQTNRALDTLRLEVKNRGVQPVARDIKVARTTLAAVLGGVARPGTVLLVTSRWDQMTRAKAARP